MTLARPPRSLALNSFAQVAGRLLLSVGRLGAAMLIVRLCGRETFGQYAVILGFVAIFEWLADFGQTDIVVRDICADRARAPAILATLRRLKRVMAATLTVLLPLAVLAFGNSGAVAMAGLVAAPGIAAYALLQVGRARLRAGMRQDLDIAAEMVGVAAMLAGTFGATMSQLPIVGLAAAYTLSRLIHAGLIAWLSGGGERLPHGGGSMRTLLLTASPIGVAGLMVAVYDGMAPIMLARLTSFSDVAAYGAAARFAMPVLTIVQALNSAFFPVLASERADRARLAETQGAVLWLTLLIAGGLSAGLAGSATFLLDLFGTGMRGDVHVLEGMCWLVFARAFTLAMSPLVVIGGAQRAGLWLTLISLVAQAIAIPLLVPRFGVIGVVAGYLAIECLLGIVPVSVLGLRATAIGFDRAGAAPLILAAVGALLAGRWLPYAGSFTGGVLAGCLFLVLAAAFGGLKPTRLRRVAAALRKRGDDS